MKIFHVPKGHSPQNAIAYIDLLPSEKEWEIIIREYKKKKTREMENQWHGILRWASKETGVPFDTLRYQVKAMFFGEHEAWIPVNNPARDTNEAKKLRNTVKDLCRHASVNASQGEIKDAIQVIAEIAHRAFGYKTDENGKTHRLYRYTGSTKKLNIDQYQSLIVQTRAFLSTEYGLIVQ